MSLLDDLNIDYAQWRPVDNPDHPRGIEGVVKDRQVWESGFGPFDMLFIVGDDGAAWSWAALGAIAAREVGRRNPQPGDRLAVAYRGDIPNMTGKGDKEMHVFRVLTQPGPNHRSGYRPPAPIQSPTQASFDDESY